MYNIYGAGDTMDDGCILKDKKVKLVTGVF